VTKIHRTVRDGPEGVNAKVVELTGFVGRQYHASAMAAAKDAGPPRRARGVTCPTCGARAPWEGNPQRPFCSITCRLIDLGVWLDERYRIPEEKADDDVPP